MFLTLGQFYQPLENTALLETIIAIFRWFHILEISLYQITTPTRVWSVWYHAVI